MTARVDGFDETTTFFVEPTVRSLRGRETTRWELTQQPDAESPAVAIGDYGSKSEAINAAQGLIR